jgi:hypothetical protein
MCVLVSGLAFEYALQRVDCPLVVLMVDAVLSQRAKQIEVVIPQACTLLDCPFLVPVFRQQVPGIE